MCFLLCISFYICSHIEKTHVQKDKFVGNEENVSMLQFWSLYADGSTELENKSIHNETCLARRKDWSSKCQWIQKLQYHQKLYHVNPFAGYDYIIALSGVNDIKRILVPFLVDSDDDDDDDDNHSGSGGSADVSKGGIFQTVKTTIMHFLHTFCKNALGG
jgi:hypothetical protein